MLELEALTKSFAGRTVVHDLSFTLKTGEVLGFLGQNGAGKSTTMRMISGVLEPDSGDAHIMGKSILGARTAAQTHLGYLPEGAPIYLDMTPEGYLRFLADAHGMEVSARRDAIDRVLAETRITHVARQSILTLSKGYRRRVALAGALLHDPEVLLLDEPTDGLDPIQKQAVRALIAHMSTEKAIMISTHTLEEVDAMCTRAILIDAGRIIADDTPQTIAAPHNGSLETAFVALTQRSETVRTAS